MHHLVNTFNVHWSFSETPAPKPQERPSCRFGDLPIGAMFKIREVHSDTFVKSSHSSGDLTDGGFCVFIQKYVVYPLVKPRENWKVMPHEFVLYEGEVLSGNNPILGRMPGSEVVNVLVMAPRS